MVVVTSGVLGFIALIFMLVIMSFTYGEQYKFLRDLFLMVAFFVTLLLTQLLVSASTAGVSPADITHIYELGYYACLFVLIFMIFFVVIILIIKALNYFMKKKHEERFGEGADDTH